MHARAHGPFPRHRRPTLHESIDNRCPVILLDRWAGSTSKQLCGNRGSMGPAAMDRCSLAPAFSIRIRTRRKLAAHPEVAAALSPTAVRKRERKPDNADEAKVKASGPPRASVPVADLGSRPFGIWQMHTRLQLTAAPHLSIERQEAFEASPGSACRRQFVQQLLRPILRRSNGE